MTNTSNSSTKHHAEFSNFSGNLTKEESYRLLIDSAKALFMDEQRKLPVISNLSNAASLLWHLYQEITPSVNWAGFYLRDSSINLDKETSEKLVLGPFQGKVACQLIKIGKGVCGTAAAKGETQIVPNVNDFPGHIACDQNTNSEIVVPIIFNSYSGSDISFPKVIGVIDIDSLNLNSFDQIDKKYLEEFAKVIVEYTDWDRYYA